MLEIDTSKIKGALIDFDGTLIDSDEIHHRAYTLALKTIDLPYISLEEHVKNNVGFTSEEILEKELRKNSRTLVGLDELVLMKRYIFTQLTMKEGVKLIEGSIDFLNKLKEKGVKMALCSSGKFAVIQRMMAVSKLPNIFDTIVSREMVTNTKPDPESYIVAMKNLNIDKEQCIGFENDKAGVEALLKAGVKTIGVSPRTFKDIFGKFESQITIIKNFSEVEII